MAITTTVYDESQGNLEATTPITYTLPTAYDKAKEAYKAAGVFAGDDGKMSKHELRQWRKLYGIDKGKARLMRRAINSGGFDSSNPSELGKVYKSAFDATYMNPIRAKQAALDSSEYAKLSVLKEKNDQDFNNWAASQEWNKQVSINPWSEGASWLDTNKIGNSGFQGILNLLRYLGVKDDGIFGEETKTALLDKINNTVNIAEKQQLINAAKQLNSTFNLNLNFQDVSDEDRLKWANTGQHNWEGYRNSYNTLKQNKVTAINKQGGKMNINYFQEGGTVAQLATSTQSPKLDIQALVVQLVQAAMQGDLKATEAINQIMSAAKQGDLQALQIAQLIQEVAKQMQSSATSAKYGAKLAYIHSLKTGCPTGYEVSYNKKGGHICKECVKKMDNGGKSLIDEVVKKLRAKYPQYDDDQLAGRKAIIIKGESYYMNGDGDLIKASQISKHNLGGEVLPVIRKMAAIPHRIIKKVESTITEPIVSTEEPSVEVDSPISMAVLSNPLSKIGFAASPSISIVEMGRLAADKKKAKDKK